MRCSVCVNCSLLMFVSDASGDHIVDPQDIPVNLWDKLVKTVRELSFLDQDNLD